MIVVDGKTSIVELPFADLSIAYKVISTHFRVDGNGRVYLKLTTKGKVTDLVISFYLDDEHGKHTIKVTYPVYTRSSLGIEKVSKGEYRKYLVALDFTQADIKVRSTKGHPDPLSKEDATDIWICRGVQLGNQIRQSQWVPTPESNEIITFNPFNRLNTYME